MTNAKSRRPYAALGLLILVVALGVVSRSQSCNCVSNTDCPTGYLCINNQCTVLACQTSANCPSGTYCNAGKCNLCTIFGSAECPCTSASQCGGGNVLCKDGRCVPNSCLGPDDYACPIGQYCDPDQNKCVLCGVGSTPGAKCGVTCPCEAPYYCDVAQGICEYPEECNGEICTPDSTNPGAHQCCEAPSVCSRAGSTGASTCVTCEPGKPCPPNPCSDPSRQPCGAGCCPSGQICLEASEGICANPKNCSLTGDVQCGSGCCHPPATCGNPITAKCTCAAGASCCPSGFVWNSEAGTCDCASPDCCSSNHKWDPSASKCICEGLPCGPTGECCLDGSECINGGCFSGCPDCPNGQTCQMDNAGNLGCAAPCPPGYVRSSTSGCELACSSAERCTSACCSSSSCLPTQCAPSCGSGGSCPMGAVCDSSTNKCTDPTCVNLMPRNEHGECGCLSDDECPGAYCDGYFCHYCKTPGDCPDFCMDGTRSYSCPCQGEGSCTNPNQDCVAGHCQLPCPNGGPRDQNGVCAPDCPDHIPYRPDGTCANFVCLSAGGSYQQCGDGAGCAIRGECLLCQGTCQIGRWYPR